MDPTAIVLSILTVVVVGVGIFASIPKTAKMWGNSRRDLTVRVLESPEAAFIDTGIVWTKENRQKAIIRYRAAQSTKSS